MGLSSSIFNLSTLYILVVCEKHAVAQRIAHALGTFNAKKISSTEIGGHNKMGWTPSPFFSAMDKKDQHFVICSVLGHLYGLVDARGNRSYILCLM
jgi:DNA topoisomerase I